MYGALDTSASALVANRQWLQVTASNLANQNTLRGPDGEYAPFRRKLAIFAAGDPASGKGSGVHLRQIVEDDSPLRAKFEPEHPFADERGYVYYPNVSPVIEQMNALIASRAYEANVTAAQATKNMMQTSMRLLA